jgi:prephenate dehydratase
LDVEGMPTHNPLRQAVHHLEELCSFVRVLGSYRPFFDFKGSRKDK